MVLSSQAQPPTKTFGGTGQKNLTVWRKFCDVDFSPTREPVDPTASMHGIFTYIWLDLMVNVGTYKPCRDPMGMVTTPRDPNIFSEGKQIS